MAICICKGTALQQNVAATLTTVAQVISLDGPGMESESCEADTLDNSSAGIPYKTTGRTEGGSVSGELFLDPALQGHNNLQYLLDEPRLAGVAATTETEGWNLIFADSGTTEWPFNGAGFALSPKVALNDGLKASFSIKLDGLPTFPVSGSV